MDRLPLQPNSPVKPLSKDTRDFRIGYVFQLPKISEIPLTDWFFDTPLEIKNQADRASDGLDDMCVAAGATSVAEDHEGMLLDEGYAFAKMKQLMGDWQEFGGDLRTMAKAACKFGFLPKSKSPFSDRKRNFVANWENWPDIYDEYAAEHAQASYFLIEGPYDYFDNIRAALWLFREKKHSVLAASYWYPAYAFPAVIPKVPQTAQPTAHAFKVRIGQKIIDGVPHLAIQQSYGEGAGENGTQYFPREVVNREWKDFGAFMFVDIDPEDVKQMKVSILQRIIRLLQKMLYVVQSAPPPTITPAPAPTPEPVPEPVPEPESLQDMARRVCGEEKLAQSMTADLMATIHGESSWNPTAINRNDNGTTDYGLCQFNSKWYIGPTLEVKTPEEALQNPEKCVRVMARAFLRGRAIDWIAYRNGSYKKYLSLYS